MVPDWVCDLAAPRGSARTRARRKLCAARRSMFTLREASAPRLPAADLGGNRTWIGYRKTRLSFQCSGVPGRGGHGPAGHGLAFVPAKLELSDLVAMHLVRPVREAQRAGVRPGVRKPEVVADASPAVRLDGPVEDLERHVRSGHLDHRDLLGGRLVADRIHPPGGVEGEQPRLVDEDAGVGDALQGHRLLRDALPEGHAPERALAHLL